MPCTYSTVDLKERERERERQEEAARLREEERKRQEVERKKKALFIALNALGFDVEARDLGGGKTFINGTEGEQNV